MLEIIQKQSQHGGTIPPQKESTERDREKIQRQQSQLEGWRIPEQGRDSQNRNDEKQFEKSLLGIMFLRILSSQILCHSNSVNLIGAHNSQAISNKKLSYLVSVELNQPSLNEPASRIQWGNCLGCWNQTGINGYKQMTITSCQRTAMR